MIIKEFNKEKYCKENQLDSELYNFYIRHIDNDEKQYYSLSCELEIKNSDEFYLIKSEEKNILESYLIKNKINKICFFRNNGKIHESHTIYCEKSNISILIQKIINIIIYPYSFIKNNFFVNKELNKLDFFHTEECQKKIDNNTKINSAKQELIECLENMKFYNEKNMREELKEQAIKLKQLFEKYKNNICD